MNDKALRLRGILTTKSTPSWLRREVTYLGQGVTGFIEGLVTEKNIPVSRRVMVYHRLSGRLSAQSVSGVDGKYKVFGLVAGVSYFVTSVDRSGDEVVYNAVTKDLITASEVVV